MVMFRVRASSLGEVAAQLQTVVAVFDAHVATADGTVKGIVNASWKGEDADKFETDWSTWMEQATLVRTALTTLASQLTSGEASYVANESGLQGGMISRRQANQGAVDHTSLVYQSVEIGQDRADSIESRQRASAGAFAAAVGRGGGQQGGAAEPRPAAASGEAFELGSQEASA